MTYVTLWSPGGTGGGAPNGAPAGALPNAESGLLARLLALSPHAAVGAWGGGTLAWLDGRGLPARALARAARAAAAAGGLADVRAGAARVPVAAAVAARWGAAPGAAPGAGARAPCTAVAPGHEAAFLAPHPIAVLLDDAAPGAARRAAAALADAGVATCGALAALTAEAVEVRLGAAGAALWRLARAEDRRVVFGRAEREGPSASVAWTGWELREPGPLVFAVAGLVARVCDALAARGEAARALVLTLSLAGGGAVARRVRGARDAADPAAWRRLVRAELERVGAEGGGLPDGVVGVALAVEPGGARAARAPQADLFDRGAASALAAERAAARLVEDGAGRVVRPVAGAHALPEARLASEPLGVEAALAAPVPAALMPAEGRAGPGRGAAGRAGRDDDDGRAPGRPERSEEPTAPRDGAGRGALTLAPPPAREAPRSARDDGVRRPTRPPLTLVRSAPAAPATGVPNTSPNTSPGAAPDPAADALRLRLLPAPRPVAVTTRAARGHRVPARYRERLAEGARAPRGGQPLVEVLAAAGPDRVVAGYDEGGAPVARDYWHCLTDQGALVLLYRDRAADAEGAAAPGDAPRAPAGGDGPGADPADGGWRLHGWWD